VGPLPGPAADLEEAREHRAHHGRDEKSPHRPFPDDEEPQASVREAQQNVVPEERVRGEAEAGQHQETAQVEREKGRASRLGPPELDGEPGAEKEGEGRVGLGLDQEPDRPADHLLNRRPRVPREVVKAARGLVEVNQDHAEEGEAAQDVERVDPLVRGDGSGQRG
jgi:hypothetical protein